MTIDVVCLTPLIRYEIEWFSSSFLSSLRSWRDFGRTSAFVSVAKPWTRAAKPRGDWRGVELKFHSRLHRSQISSRDAREKMASPSQNIARSRIPPATQASYFRYFTLRMCGELELVCGALELVCGALEPRCGALEHRGAQTAILKSTSW